MYIYISQDALSGRPFRTYMAGSGEVTSEEKSRAAALGAAARRTPKVVKARAEERSMMVAMVVRRTSMHAGRGWRARRGLHLRYLR
jgi:hypothetical protein